MNIIIEGHGSTRTFTYKSVFSSMTVTQKYKTGLLSWFELLSQIGKMTSLIWKSVMVWHDGVIENVTAHGKTLSYADYKTLSKKDKKDFQEGTYLFNMR